MCGFILTNQKISLKKYKYILKHRGPHSSGLFKNNKISIFFNRLSIVDLKLRSNQPMKFMNLILVFNGEIYNYKYLKELLIKKGYKFKTSSDTEVLLKLFHKYGKKSLEFIEGMFAFVVYNTDDNSLFIARDAFGIKPIFYNFSENSFFISSEKISFLQGDCNKDLNREAICQYIKYGEYQGSEDTFFKNIKSLLPGSCIYYKNNKINFSKWYRIKDKVNKVGYKDAKKELERLLTTSIENCLIGDRKIALSCSGGVDSSIIAEICKKIDNDNLEYMLHYTSKEENDEEHFAREINKSLKLKFIRSIFKKKDFDKYLTKSISSMNEPIGGLNTLNAFKSFEELKKKKIFVLLDGNGSDEILGGYKHHILSFYKNKKFSNLSIHGSNYYFDQKLLTKEFRDIPKNLNFELNFSDNTKNIMFNELMGSKVRRNLIQGDHLSMQNSVETRYPYLNKNLVEFCFSLPTKYLFRNNLGKFILRDLFKNKNFKKPKRILQNPQNIWMKKFIIKKLINDIKRDKNFFDHKIFEKKELLKYLDKNTKSNSSVIEWRILMIYKFLKSLKI